MGWLDMLSVGLDVVTYSQVHKTRQQMKNLQASQQAAILQDEYLKVLRNLVFANNQSALAIREHLDTTPQKVFVGARLLAWRYQSLGISADMFPEFADKDYVADTERNISGLIRSSQEKLSPEQILDGEACIEAILEMPQLNEAIENETQNKSIRAAQARADEVEKELAATDEDWKPLSSEKSKRMLIGLALAILGPGCVCFSGLIFSGILSSAAGSLSQNPSIGNAVNSLGGLINLVMLALAGAATIGGLVYAIRAPSEDYGDLARKRAEIKSRIPKVAPLLQLPSNYIGKNLDELTSLRNAKQDFVQTILGDTDDDYDMVFLQGQR